MNSTHEYLHRIVQRSGLTHREQTAWIEEMSAHLADKVENLKASGCPEEEAVEKALHSFGSRREIRRQIALQTFGVTLPIITFFASLFFVLFLLGVFLLYASIATSPDPSTWSSWHENQWVYFFTSQIPISPSLMLALCVDMIMLVKTRSSKDRLALVLITGVYCALWFLMRVSHHYDVAELLVTNWSKYSPPFGAFELASYFLLLSLSIGMYILTKNRSIGRFPIVLSLVLGLWVPIRDSIQYHLWKATHWDALWGHYDPFMYEGGFILITIVIRLLLLALLLYVFRKIDRFMPIKHPTISN